MNLWTYTIAVLLIGFILALSALAITAIERASILLQSPTLPTP